MPSPIEDRRPPITPQLAVRVAVLGGVAFVLFAIIFFRLWFLQVLTGDDYVSQARDNRVRKIKIEAPRGNIVDRNGKTLVKTRAAPVVQLLPNAVPDAEMEAADEYRKALAAAEGRRLAAARDLRALERRLRADGRRTPPGGEAPSGAGCATQSAPRREGGDPADPRRRGRAALAVPAARPGDRRAAAHDPPARVQRHRRPAVGERDDQDRRPGRRRSTTCSSTARTFPGVVVEKKYLRNYPYDELGAQLFGTLREISPDELEDRALPRRQPGHADRQGRDRGDLRQVPARHRRLHARDRQLDRATATTRAAATRVPPIQGRQLRLTLDLGLQRAANNAVARGDRRGERQRQPGRRRRVRGAGPARRRGARARLLPELRREPVREADRPGDLRAAQLRGERRAAVQPRDLAPAIRRLDVQADHVVRGDGQRGHHARAPCSTTRACSSTATASSRTPATRVFGSLALPRALQVSSDVFFYQLGAALNDTRPGAAGVGAQARLRQADGDRPAGRVRRPGARRASGATRVRQVPDVREEGQGRRPGPPRRCTRAAASSAAGAAATTSTSPSARATCRPRRCSSRSPTRRSPNGGRVVTPHLGQQVEDGAGRQLEEIRKPAKRRVDFDPTDARGGPRPACAPRPARPAARRPTSSRASPTPSTARPAPPSARPTPTSPGTRRTSTTRSSRSSSS